MRDHESDDGSASEKDAVEVVVLQTATSWRGSQHQPRVRRSVAGEQLAHAAASQQPQMPWIPAVKLPAAALSKQRGELQQLVMVVTACVSWVLASSGAILVNKHIMVDLHFPYPASVCALGLVGTSIVSWAAVRLLRLAPASGSVSLRFYVTRVLPTGLFQALSMQLGNTAYLHLSVAFVQMLKAFTPVSTMLFAFAFKLERPSARLIASVGLITAGVLAATAAEGNISFIGVTAMVASMLCEGLRLVMMQSLVSNSKRAFQPLEALMYLAPAASFWVLLIALSTEALQMHQEQHLAELAAHPGYVLASAAAGFGVNAAAMAVISLASALTLKVLGICKDIGLVMYGVVMLGEHVGHAQMAGYGVSLLGLVWYNAIKACGTAAAAAGSTLPGAHAAAAAAAGPGSVAGVRGSSSAAGRRRSTVGAGAAGAAAAAAAAAVAADGQAAAAVKAAVVRR